MTLPGFTKSKLFRISFVIALLAGIVGVSIATYLFNLEHTDLSRVKPAYSLRSADLYSSFESDETVASAKYLNKILEVKGKIAELEFGSSDSTLSITLREDDQFSGVICTFSGIKKQNEVKVSPGDIVTVRGECSGMLMDVLLNNCVFVK